MISSVAPACANVKKFNPIWGTPDLWVFFPGCGVKVTVPLYGDRIV